MRWALTCLLLAGVCWTAPLAQASSTRDFVTGEDWTEHMSAREKQISLVPPALLFTDYDVHLRLSLPQYIPLIDKIMERNPRLADEEVSSIFASTIYLFEPQNRPALRRMEMDFLRGDVESAALPGPRLTFEDVLSEAAPAED